MLSWDPLGFCRDRPSDISLHSHKRAHHSVKQSPIIKRYTSQLISFYLMLLSSENLVRHFWMMWSAKSDSGIRFSDCRSFSKYLTCSGTPVQEWNPRWKPYNFDTLICSSPAWFILFHGCDFLCQRISRRNVIKILLPWAVLQNSPSRSFPPCRTLGPWSWCRQPYSGPVTSPGTDDTHIHTQKKAGFLTTSL